MTSLGSLPVPAASAESKNTIEPPLLGNIGSVPIVGATPVISITVLRPKWVMPVLEIFPLPVEFRV